VPYCSTCGTQIADGASCPKCVAGTAPTGAAPTGSVATAGAGLDDNIAGALAYVTIIPAILFLVLEPYNRKRFVRFHAFQSVFFFLGWAVLNFGLAFFSHIPFLGWATLPLFPLITLVMFLILFFLMFKAYQGQTYKLPLIGDMAAQQAGS
jgi:uncharacterized membrane protein